MRKHPIQPLEKDDHGTVRFKRNAIVRHLLDHGGIDLNQIAAMNFPREDRVQFAQLIGYSLEGFSELRSYVSDDDYAAAAIMATGKKSEEQSRIQALEQTLAKIRKGLVSAACAAFQVHPDDLQP